MTAGQGCNIRKYRDLLKDGSSDTRMAANALPFGLVELVRLVENGVGHRKLAEVVEKGRAA